MTQAPSRAPALSSPGRRWRSRLRLCATIFSDLLRSRLRPRRRNGSSKAIASSANVQGVRLAVNRITGEIRILHSAHAADIGRLINPMQCRGQIEGSVAMGLGWALIENM